MPANLENSAVATGLERVSFHSNPKERQCQRMLKLLHNSLISHASKVMLKILQARLQQYVNREHLEVQAGFRKGRGTKGQIANIHWIIEKISTNNRCWGGCGAKGTLLHCQWQCKYNRCREQYGGSLRN